MKQNDKNKLITSKYYIMKIDISKHTKNIEKNIKIKKEENELSYL